MRHRVRTSLAVALIALAAASCGKKGLPHPPLKIIPEEIEDMRVRQVGERVVLTFRRPVKRTDATPLEPDARIEILMDAQDPPPAGPTPIEENPLVVWEIGYAEWNDYAEGNRLRVMMRLESIASGMERPMSDLFNHRINFTVRVVEKKKRRSRASSPGSLIVCTPPPSPSDGRVELTAEGIVLTWIGHPAGSPGRFNVYRTGDEEPRPEKPLNPQPLSESTLLDAGVPAGRAYHYTVRSAGELTGCESADGAAVSAVWEDTFPPPPPEALDAVAEQGTIRLFWRPNMDADLAGYRVYRADGPDQPMRRLTQEVIVTTTYTDIAAKPGIKYHYAVTALDLANPPNESAYSNVAVEEMASQ